MDEQPPKVIPMTPRKHKQRLPTPRRPQEDWENKLALSGKFVPISSHANIALILRHTPSSVDRLRYNTFTDTIEIGPPTLDEFGRPVSVRVWTKKDTHRLAEWLLDKYHLTAALPHVTSAVESVAEDVRYDPIVTWLESLPPWNEIERIPLFFPAVCGVPDTPYTRFCGISLFVSLVARAYCPGCQADTSIVLQGPQGVGKTRLCRLLGGPWFHPITISFESKDLLIALRNTWLAELAELDSLSRAGQARIKAMLTTTVDSYRPPYGTVETIQPRRAVFIGTTNDPAFLIDPTGARRFLPLPISVMQIEQLNDIFLQLFAEAKYRYQAGELWWSTNGDILSEANERRELVRDVDPWRSKVKRWVENHPDDILMDDLLGGECLDVPTERRTRAYVTRVGFLLADLNCIKKKRRIPSSLNEFEYYYVKV